MTGQGKDSSVLALEPEWEAVLEPNTFGLRTGRGVDDAIGAIFDGIRYKAKYVLDADLLKCFDKISQEALLTKLNTFPKMHRQIKAWLKSGVVLEGNLSPTEAGTPQGSVISPLLALIALHGMETALRECIPPSKDAQSELTIAIYADDFVVLHKSLEVILQCKSAVADWLRHLSLELKPSKTRISHTLNRYEGNVGFDLLGFHIRQYPVGRHHFGNNPHAEKLGFKTIIRPSNHKIDSHVESLRNAIDSHKTMPQAALIPRLNSMIQRI